MKRYFLLLLAISNATVQAFSQQQITEATYRKISGTEQTVGLIYPKVSNIQSSVNSIAQSTATRGFISGFGETIVSNLIDEINLQFQYGIPSLETSLSVLTTGTIYELDSFAVIQTGTDSSAEARIESKRALRYRTGHEGYIFFTATFTVPGVTNSTQLIGLFDDDDGAAVGYNGTEFSILFRRRGDADLFIAQSNFNCDTIDGNGPSGFNIDTSKLNIFRISYGWLGAAPIKFQVMRSDGVWITFHVIQQPNTSTGTHFKNPVLPIRAEVKNSGNTTDIKLRTPSWNAGLAGNFTTPASRFFSKSNSTTVPSTGAETHVLTLRNKSTFNSVTNRTEVRIAAIGGGGTDFSNTIVLFRIRKNATVTGTSFSDIDANNSVIEFSTAGTYSASTGTETFLIANNTFGSGPGIEFIPKSEYPIIFLPGETITLTAEILQSTNVPVLGTLSWEELF